MSFTALGLPPFILKAIEAAGYAAPTPVQAKAIPLALAQHDLLVSAQTGSGKTAAFMLPSLTRLVNPSLAPGVGPRVLALTPTRELAQQVEQAARIYGKALRSLRTVCLVGGAPYGRQVKSLAQAVDVVVATPGRLIDHIERGRIDFSRLEVLILDEADRMLDMGFIDDIRAIVARLPKTRQTLLFSATFAGEVSRLAYELTQNARRIDASPEAAPGGNIEQRWLFADDAAHKDRLLEALLRDAGLNQAVVFTATKAAAVAVSDRLRERGFSAAALHGDMPQSKRSKTLQSLRDGRIRILVATDVAARGIDVAGVSHVINFDPPRQAEDYVHRIGRTGRAGRSGVAITLARSHERHLLRGIERYTGLRLRIDEIAGLEPKAQSELGRAKLDTVGERGKRVRHAKKRANQSAASGFETRADAWKSRPEQECAPRPKRAPVGRWVQAPHSAPAYLQERERQRAYARAQAKAVGRNEGKRAATAEAF